MSRQITENDIDAEMVRRRLMRPVSGGFVDDDQHHWLTPTTSPEIHRMEREAIRAELEAAISKYHAAHMGRERWKDRVPAIQQAILQAAGGKRYLCTSQGWSGRNYKRLFRASRCA